MAPILLLPALAAGQLITNAQAIPRTGNPPVVFLNGFETDCGSVTFAKEFGVADQVLQANGRTSLFFNNCTIQNGSSIEALGNAFGIWLANLHYSDGAVVKQVDVVGYSMGGLIVRSYLSGKQEAIGAFNPPAMVPIRKIVFISTPHFGTPVGALAFGAIPQADEISSGSRFLMDLNTWNQNMDDLRGVDAIAIAGSGGTGLAVSPGFDDGLVSLSSATVPASFGGIHAPGRTRVLPLCHTQNGLLSQIFLCPPGAKGVAYVADATSDTGRILISFLSGTADWRSIGTAVESTSFLKSGAGLEVRARTATDQPLFPASISATPPGGGGKQLNMSNNEMSWTDLITAGTTSFSVNADAQRFTEIVNVSAGGANAVVLKQGPFIAAAIPAPVVVSPLAVSPRMIVAIYGSSLDASTVSAGGLAMTVLYNSSTQINAVIPAALPPGLAKLTVQNAAGSHTINIYVEPFYPEAFVIGQGGAAAVDANTGAIVSAASPLRPGDYVELYLTGLGATIRADGFEIAAMQPTVTIGGMNCPVTYAGAAPGFTGLDQINCIVPAASGGQQGLPVVVTSGLRSSAPATVWVE